MLKLPGERVAALTAAGEGAHVDPGMGRLMKEWAALADTAAADWEALVAEAQAFTAGSSLHPEDRG